MIDKMEVKNVEVGGPILNLWIGINYPHLPTDDAVPRIVRKELGGEFVVTDKGYLISAPDYRLISPYAHLALIPSRTRVFSIPSTSQDDLIALWRFHCFRKPQTFQDLFIYDPHGVTTSKWHLGLDKHGWYIIEIRENPRLTLYELERIHWLAAT